MRSLFLAILSLATFNVNCSELTRADGAYFAGFQLKAQGGLGVYNSAIWLQVGDLWLDVKERISGCRDRFSYLCDDNRYDYNDMQLYISDEKKFHYGNFEWKERKSFCSRRLDKGRVVQASDIANLKKIQNINVRIVALLPLPSTSCFKFKK
jgi:hypothetical protein